LTQPSIAPGDRLAGRYRVESVLGTGGMGCVYRALDESLGRPVALKVMHAAMAAHAGRFEREARAGAAIAHPAAVRVLAFGLLDDARPYLALEFVEGESLSALLRREGPMDPARAVALMRPIAGVLAEAHTRGVIHRDLKPENLLWTRSPGMPEGLRLLDFGIAGLEAAEGEAPVEKLTVTGQVFGTPEYMAPEQAMGKKTSPATDVWAFGAVLAAMLNGRSPFHGAHVPEILFRVVNATPEALPPDASAGLVDLVTACLQKSPADRPPNGEALLARLEALPTPETPRPATLAPPLPASSISPRSASGFASGTRPPALRRPVFFAVGGALAGALVVAGALSSGKSDAPAPAASSLAGAAPTPAAPTPSAPGGDVVRRELLAMLAAGRVPEAVAALRTALEAHPELATDAGLVAAVLEAFAGKEGAPLAEMLAGPLAPAARAGLLTMAGSADARARWRAVRTLPVDSPEARTARIQALRQDLRADDCEVRRHTMSELADMGDPSVIPDIRAARARYNFLENICLGDADAAAIRRLKK
jgi:serine/threonine protein kinase